MLGEIYEIAAIKKELDEWTDLYPTRTELKRLPYYENSGNNASIVVDGDPFAFINKLTQNIEKRSTFFDMTEAQISNLQPMIRLFKIIEKSDGSGIEEEVEMEFDSNMTKKNMDYFLKSKLLRGTGVGIKDFTISYEADNPFAITKSIKAKLKLHAVTFDELLRTRKNSEGKPYSYIDLALKTGGSASKLHDLETKRLGGALTTEDKMQIENLSKLLFRLKVVIGWAIPNGAFGGGIITSDLKDAIDQSCITLNLTPVIHEYNFDDAGRVDFVINYLAYVEDFFDQPKFNIFSNGTSTSTGQYIRSLRTKEFNKKCDSAEQTEEEEKKESTALDLQRETALRDLVERMITSKKVCYMNMSLKQMAKYKRDGPAGMPTDEIQLILNQLLIGTDPWSQLLEDATEAEMEEELRTRAKSATTAAEIAPVNPLQTISFVYLSDLMDIILEGIGSFFPAALTAIDAAKPALENAVLEKANLTRYEANFKRYRLVLGPLEITNANKEKDVVESAFVSLGDVPISMRYFLEWLTKKMLKKDEVIYPLPRFTNDLINELLRNFLNSDQCFKHKARQPTRLGESVLTAYTDSIEKPKLDELTQKIIDPDSTDPLYSNRRLRMSGITSDLTPILSVNGNRSVQLNNPGVDKEINYMVYYAARTQPTELMRGCRGGPGDKCYDKDDKSNPKTPIPGDHDRGVWHYQIGRDKGIVKNIQLKKTDAPGLKELRFEQEGYDGLQQLREMYDATIECYGDVSAFPGLYIYISPGGFSPGASMDLTQFGIGGYYMIIRSEHSFGPGKADTTITAKWVAEIDATLTQNANTDSDSIKCNDAAGQRTESAHGETSMYWERSLDDLDGTTDAAYKAQQDALRSDQAARDR